MAAASNQNIARKWEEHKQSLLENGRDLSNSVLNKEWINFVHGLKMSEIYPLQFQKQEAERFGDEDEIRELDARYKAIMDKYARIIRNGQPNVREPGISGGRRRKTYRRKSHRRKTHRRRK
jgi:hypothetical protein